RELHMSQIRICGLSALNRGLRNVQTNHFFANRSKLMSEQAFATSNIQRFLKAAFIQQPHHCLVLRDFVLGRPELPRIHLTLVKAFKPPFAHQVFPLETKKESPPERTNQRVHFPEPE